MLVMRTIEDPANPIGEFVSAQQPVGFDYFALAINPPGLYGVYALRIVAALHEVPEHEIYGFLHLGNVPPAVPVEDLVQALLAQQVASRHAEQMAGRPPLRIAEGEWDLPLPFEIVGDLPELIHSLRCLGHEILYCRSLQVGRLGGLG